MEQPKRSEWIELVEKIIALIATIISCITVSLALVPAIVSKIPTSVPIQTIALATPSPSPGPLKTVLSSSATAQAIITNIVMSKDVKNDTLDPVDVTYAFPANQSIFHVVVTIKDAPKDTAIGAFWFADAGKPLANYELKSEGSRNLDLWLKPDGGKLSPGNYRVEIRLNGTPYSTTNFTVVAEGASSSGQPKPSGLISSVTMAEKTQGATKDPVNPTSVFAPNSIFHAVVSVQNAPANTKFTAVWYAVDAGNTLIDQTDLATDGTRNIDFTLTPTTTWSAGVYRVEIYVNGRLDTVKIFSVK
jgi:hypothetical protein